MKLLQALCGPITALMMFGLGCSKQPEAVDADPASPAWFTLMQFHLDRYGMVDRDGDHQKNDPVPPAVRDAVQRIILQIQPDVLTLHQIGSRAALDELKADLAAKGLDLPHDAFLDSDPHGLHQAVLSKFPMVSRQLHTNDTYRIGTQELHVNKGFIDVDIQISSTKQFKLITGELKSKDPHPAGQTEMRRNESRFLHYHVRDALKADPDRGVVVTGTFYDHKNSAALKTIRGKQTVLLKDLRPVDSHGSVWTWRDEDVDAYMREDYILTGPGVETIHAWVVDDPLTLVASPHRPLVAEIKVEPAPASR